MAEFGAMAIRDYSKCFDRSFECGRVIQDVNVHSVKRNYAYQHKKNTTCCDSEDISSNAGARSRNILYISGSTCRTSSRPVRGAVGTLVTGHGHA